MGLLKVLSSMKGVATCIPLLYPCLSVSLSLHLFPLIFLSLSLSFFLSVPLCLSVYLCLFPLCLFSLFVSLTLCLCLPLSFCLSDSSLYVSLSLSPLPHPSPFPAHFNLWTQELASGPYLALVPSTLGSLSIPLSSHPGLCVDLSQTPPDSCAQSDPCFAQQHKKIRATNGFFPC